MHKPPFLRHPKLAWLVTALVLLANALLSPSSRAGGISFLLITALSGAALAWAFGAWSPKLPRRIADFLVVAVVLYASVKLFAPSWARGGFSLYDWGPHHANLRHLVDGLRAGHIPRWVHGVSTGDSPFELYPLLPYYLAAKAAILTEATDLTLVMVRGGILTHVLSAAGAAVLANRVLPWPAAIVVGMATLYDLGSVWGGGINGILGLGVAHSALANAIWSWVLVAIVATLERPRLWCSMAVWLSVMLAIACHPIALLSAVATCGALLLVALLARDVPARRALLAIAHVALGAALAAFVWQPFSARVLMYGVHFAVPGQLTWRALESLMLNPVPETSFAPLVFAGLVGLLAGVFSRRAVPTLLACFASILLIGIADQLYVLLDLAPSLEVARLQTVRMAAPAKVGVYICGISLAYMAVNSVTARTPDRTRLVLGALVACLAAGFVRGGTPYVDNLSVVLRANAHKDVPDSDGMRKLITWAREQNRGLTPSHYARLLHEDHKFYYSVYHINAETRLPTLWVGPVSALFLRERIEDASPSSLRRFNVRWVMRRDAPPKRGNPATELRFGSYYVRELDDWDGQFARVERGQGEALVTRLDDERIDVELRNTDQPALVALGMGYYPRWQAHHAVRGVLPVYAMPTIPGGKLQVAAAWLPPGKTTFRPDKPLPSDGKGRTASALGALLAIAISAVWSLRRARSWCLRKLALGLRLARPHLAVSALACAILATLALTLASVGAAGAPSDALQLGSGLRGSAKVEARLAGGKWRKCKYSFTRGGYRCRDLLLIQDAMGQLLNDAEPSPPFAVPVIAVSALAENVEFRIKLKANFAGTYWAATNRGKVDVRVPSGAVLALSEVQSEHVLEATDAREVSVSGSVQKDSLEIAFVRRDRIVPERGYLTAPEQLPSGLTSRR